MFGAMATGRTRITGLLEAEDVLNTARIVTQLGAKAIKTAIGWEVQGCGTGGLTQPAAALDFGNAGILKDGRVVFNIAGNMYRLVVWINYAYGVVYVRFIGTHAQYDRIDAQSI